jgi:hypothetical protein
VSEPNVCTGDKLRKISWSAARHKGTRLCYEKNQSGMLRGTAPECFQGTCDTRTLWNHSIFPCLPMSCTLSGCCAWARCLLPTSASPCDTTHTPHNNPHERSTAARIAWLQSKMDALGDRHTLGFTQSSSVLKTPDRLPRQGRVSSCK